MNTQNAVATAFFRDTWAGVVPVYLLPQKTVRGGVRAIVYRWQRDNGMIVDGLRCGFGADKMVAIAKRDVRFGDIAR